jgi:hypothetical protein
MAPKRQIHPPFTLKRRTTVSKPKLCVVTSLLALALFTFPHTPAHAQSADGAFYSNAYISIPSSTTAIKASIAGYGYTLGLNSFGRMCISTSTNKYAGYVYQIEYDPDGTGDYFIADVYSVGYLNGALSKAVVRVNDGSNALSPGTVDQFGFAVTPFGHTTPSFTSGLDEFGDPTLIKTGLGSVIVYPPAP